MQNKKNLAILPPIAHFDETGGILITKVFLVKEGENPGQQLVDQVSRRHETDTVTGLPPLAVFLLFFVQSSNVVSMMGAGFVVAILAGFGLFVFSRGEP